MKKFRVYLFRTPDYIRGWLAYRNHSGFCRPTLTVLVEAESGTKAKNAAITAANRGFKGVEIIEKNYSSDLYSLNNFPDLLENPKIGRELSVGKRDAKD